jgi:hypothetical protein
VVTQDLDIVVAADTLEVAPELRDRVPDEILEKIPRTS